jgi:hypothetical protein
MTRNEEDRPVHLDHNVTTGATTYTPITDTEWDEMEQRERDAIAANLAAEQEAALLAAAAQAHPDPLVQALAKKAGLL